MATASLPRSTSRPQAPQYQAPAAQPPQQGWGVDPGQYRQPAPQAPQAPQYQAPAPAYQQPAPQPPQALPAPPQAPVEQAAQSLAHATGGAVAPLDARPF